MKNGIVCQTTRHLGEGPTVSMSLFLVLIVLHGVSSILPPPATQVNVTFPHDLMKRFRENDRHWRRRRDIALDRYIRDS